MEWLALLATVGCFTFRSYYLFVFVPGRRLGLYVGPDMRSVADTGVSRWMDIYFKTVIGFFCDRILLSGGLRVSSTP